MHRPVSYESTWLDSPLTSDGALNNPDALVSRRIKQPSLNQQQSPVCVLVHGFSASSYEFESLKASLLAHDPDLLFSAVVMGGHGRDYESFKSASYQDWLKPIVEEVQSLALNGHQQIILIGASTGATGILHLLMNDTFKGLPIKQLILIDPYIVPKDKRINLVPVLRFLIGNTVSDATQPLEHRHWYTNRPTAALYELVKLMHMVKQQFATVKLESQNNWPKITVFTAKNDPTADTIGADKIQMAFGPDTVDIQRYDSNRHVITEPTAKRNWSSADQQHYDFVLNHVLSLLKN